MAEGFLRAVAEDAFEAYSAGSVPRDLDPLAVAVMAERGIDIADQRPKGLHGVHGQGAVRLCHHRLRSRQGLAPFPGRGTREFWPLEDPGRVEGNADARLAKFREARDHIEARVRRFLVERNYKPVVKQQQGTR